MNLHFLMHYFMAKVERNVETRAGVLPATGEIRRLANEVLPVIDLEYVRPLQEAPRAAVEAATPSPVVDAEVLQRQRDRELAEVGSIDTAYALIMLFPAFLFGFFTVGCAYALVESILIGALSVTALLGSVLLGVLTISVLTLIGLETIGKILIRREINKKYSSKLAGAAA